jgi:hypothetical protein
MSKETLNISNELIESFLEGTDLKSARKRNVDNDNLLVTVV